MSNFLSASIKRILVDVKDIIKNPLHDNGIYYFHNEDNIYNGKAMIIGPSDTPYQYGYYFFNFTFSNDYPYSPPKVSFCTQGEQVRFNPNLYTNGKVCLSLLNTWPGDPWTSVQTISSILLTLSSILNNEPLLNEPYISKPNLSIKTYNDIIEFSNYKIAFLGMYTGKYILSGFEVFKEIIDEKMKEYLPLVIKKCEALEQSEINNKLLTINLYHFSMQINYTDLLKQLNIIKNKIEV